VNGGRVIQVYIDVKQLYVDAKVASILCVGGPIAYKLREGVDLSEEWLYEHVAPHIKHRFPNDNRMCRALALALLWGCLDPEQKQLMPGALQARVEAAWNAHCIVSEEDTHNNPVVKVPLVVYRIADNLCIDELGVPMAGEGEQGDAVMQHEAAVAAAGERHDNGEQFQALLIQLQQTQTTVNNNHQSVLNSIGSLRSWSEGQFQQLNSNIRRFGGTIQGGLARQGNQVQRQQARAEEQVARAEGVQPGSATLLPKPKELMELWTEYKFGIGGRKPAEQFTRAERNLPPNKQKYYRRKVVWECIDRLVRQGYTAQAACHKIREVYGFRSSVTTILNKMLYQRNRQQLPESLS
jgi:hypothetical protein